jgi:hypothetical protein
VLRVADAVEPKRELRCHSSSVVKPPLYEFETRWSAARAPAADRRGPLRIGVGASDRRLCDRVNSPPPPIHINARQQLGEQPQPDKDDPGLHEDGAEQEERPVGEKHGSAGHDFRERDPPSAQYPGGDADESNRSEEVQRTRDVLQQESDGDQVGGNAPRARQSVMRLILWSWDIGDRHLQQIDVEVRHKREAIELAVHRESQRTRELKAFRDVAALELRVAQEDLRMVQERFQAERANLRDVETARLEESDKWVAFLQADYESQQAQLELLKTTGQLGRLLP